ncbi:MAG: PA14 domain-containing protein [Anaerolineae bacterium]
MSRCALILGLLLLAGCVSVRWTRTATIAAGRWRFRATVDDGVRVYVDGLPIIDRWHPSGVVTYNTSIALSGGVHLLRVDYYDNIEQARVRVWWEPDDGSPTDPAHAGAWRGDYFGNRDLAGAPVFSRDDPAIYFDWGESGPGGGIAGQDFSARWTRPMFIPGGKYLFKARADDGVRVWLDGVALIDQWRASAGDATYTREQEVSNGNHIVTVEYFQGGGAAAVRVMWQPMNVDWVGNLYTCQLEQDSWIKVYRLAPNNQWEDLKVDGYDPNAAGGQLTLFGAPVDASFGWDGQPYKVELWIKGQRIRVEGDIFAGQPAFRIMPRADVRTSWPCGAALPRQVSSQ